MATFEIQLTTLNEYRERAVDGGWDDLCVMIDDIVKNTHHTVLLKGKASVPEKDIRKAYGEVCSEWKQKIAKEFPLLDLDKSKYYTFNTYHTLQTDGAEEYMKDNPLIIGNSWANSGEELKCLFLDNEFWEFEIEPCKRDDSTRCLTMFKFKKK
jgi:hypothetical protein